MFERQQDPC